MLKRSDNLSAEKNLIIKNASILILKLLCDKDMYGYEMIQLLSKMTDRVIELKVGTLYPLLHRMVQSGYLVCYNQEVNGKLRKYYSITDDGKKYLKVLLKEWEKYMDSFYKVVNDTCYEC